MRLNVFWINVHLLCEECFVKSKLVSSHRGVAALSIPTPRASLPVEDVDLSVRCCDNTIDVALKDELVLVLDRLLKRNLRSKNFILTKVIFKRIFNLRKNVLTLTTHLLYKLFVLGL